MKMRTKYEGVAGDFYSIVGQRKTGSQGGLGWNCYPNAAAFFHRSNSGDLVAVITFRSGGSQAMFSTPVYELGVIDKTQQLALRWMNSEFQEQFKAECTEKSIDWQNAIDEVYYTNILDYDDACVQIRELIRDYYTRNPNDQP